MKKENKPLERSEDNPRFLLAIDADLLPAIPALKKRLHTDNRNMVINYALKLAWDSLEHNSIQRTLADLADRVDALSVHHSFTTELLSELFCNHLVLSATDLTQLLKAGENMEKRRASAESLLAVAENRAARRTASGGDRFSDALELCAPPEDSGRSTDPARRSE